MDVPPGAQVAGQAQVDEAVAGIEEQQRGELVGWSRAPLAPTDPAAVAAALVRSSLIPMDPPVQLDRWQLAPRGGGGSAAAAARVPHVVGGSLVAQSAHDLHRRRKLLRRHEQIDVVGKATAKIAIDRLSEQRSLQWGAANPRIGREAIMRSETNCRKRRAAVPPLLPARPPPQGRPSAVPPPDPGCADPKRAGACACVGSRLVAASPSRRSAAQPARAVRPAGGHASAEQDDLPFAAGAGQSIRRRCSRGPPRRRSGFTPGAFLHG